MLFAKLLYGYIAVSTVALWLLYAYQQVTM